MSDTKPRALLEQAGRDMAGAVSVRLCSLGIELGLFKNLHEHGRSTSVQLAARLQFERTLYLRMAARDRAERLCDVQ